MVKPGGQVRWLSCVVKYDGPVVWSCLMVMLGGHV